MTKLLLAAGLAAAFSTSAFAQAVIESPTSTTVVVPPGSPGVVTQQPGSTGSPGAATYSPTGRAADSISPDSAAAGNENQPARIGSGSSGGSSK